LRREHFTEGNAADGVMLSQEGKREFFSRWFMFAHEERRRLEGFAVEVTYREAIFADVRCFAKFLRRESDSWPAH
jgi:hypothetical protein